MKLDAKTTRQESENEIGVAHCTELRAKIRRALAHGKGGGRVRQVRSIRSFTLNIGGGRETATANVARRAKQKHTQAGAAVAADLAAANHESLSAAAQQRKRSAGNSERVSEANGGGGRHRRRSDFQ